MRFDFVTLPLATADFLLRGTPVTLIAIGAAIAVRFAINRYLDYVTGERLAVTDPSSGR